MLSRISQLKQTISDELELASQQQKSAVDPIAVIERNKAVLAEQPPNVDEVITELNATSQEEGNAAANADSSKQDSAKQEPAKSEPAKQEPAKQETQQTAESPKKELHPSPSKDVLDSGVAAKLARLNRFQEKYPLLLKAYKAEKKRGELIKMYESVLAEHTPCTSIGQPQELVDFLNELKSDLQSSKKDLETTKRELETTKRALENAKTAADKSSTEVAQLTQQVTQLKQELAEKTKQQQDQQSTAKADAELKAKVESLQSRLASAEQSRDAAQKSQTSLKSQVDEMSVRVHEIQSECDVIRDELAETERLSQQRLKELNALKDSLRHRDRDQRQSADNINEQLTAALTEKEQLESEVEQLNKRIIRESEHLNTQIKTLRMQLLESEEHERDLRKQIALAHQSPLSKSSLELSSAMRQENTNSNENKTNTETDMVSRSQLNEALASAASVAKANELLKAVNEDHVLRIEKLQKAQRVLAADLEQVRHENTILKNRRPSVTAMAQPGASTIQNSEAEKQQAYLKNVLVGFVEHKDQRRNLLPVLATLLGLSDAEKKKFMTTF